MLLNQAVENIQTGGLQEGNAFSIAASPKAFEILSSNLYQNKVLAVIREISCNAADAHVTTGRPLSDIEVHLPTYTELWFSVRDYGPGLSHKNMLRLYTTYFLSLKDDNNDMLGGFGLGSKAPFAIADTFTVTSWHGGKKRRYAMYKDNGVPNVNLIDEQDSDEPSGLLVHVGVDLADRYKFIEEARRFFRWWPVNPAVNTQLATNIFSADNIIGKSDTSAANGMAHWTTIKSALPLGPTVCVGMVPYPLNFNAIVNIPEEISKAISESNAVFCFDVGEISISPSREALSYDPTTCANLIKRMRQFTKVIADKFVAEIKAQPTLYAANKFVWGNNTGIYKSIIHYLGLNNNLTWNGITLSKTVSLDFALAFAAHKDTCHFVEYEPRWAGSKAWTVRSSYKPDPVTPTSIVSYAHVSDNSTAHESYIRRVIVVDKISSKVYTQIKAAFTNSNTRYNTNTTLLICGVPFDVVKFVLEAAGFPPPIHIDDLPELPSYTSSTTTKSVPTFGYKINPTNGSISKTEDAIPLDGGGYYIEFFDGKPVEPVRLLQELRFWGWLDTSKNNFVGFSTNKLKIKKFQKQLDANGWQKIDPAFVKTNIPAGKLKQLYLTSHLTDTQTSSLAPLYAKLVEFVTTDNSSARVQFEIEPLWQELKPHLIDNAITNNAVNSYSMRPYNIEAAFSDSQRAAVADAGTEAQRLDALTTTFLNQHPMLKYLRWDEVSATDFFDYINR